VTEFALKESSEARVRPREPRSPLVLLATPLSSQSTYTFTKAHELARSLSADVVVLRVSTPSFTGCARPAAAGFESSVLDRNGDFLSVVIETARALQPAIIAIPELRGQTGRSVHDLALECGIPILVARDGVESGVILAASDLSNPCFPVLRTGALLSACLGARVVFLHNLAPTFSYGARTSAAPKGCPPSIVDRMEDLRLAAHALNVESQNVVTVRPKVGEALMSVIRRECPDIVIVGARAHHAANSATESLAQTMFDEIAPSIVVVPIERSRALHASHSRFGVA
jgi:hypothetical protein